MKALRLPLFAVLVTMAIVVGSVACGSSPAAPPDRAEIVIVMKSATVEPLTTTPEPGLLYRLLYEVHETAGRRGATLVSQHFAMSDGGMFNGNFNSALTPPHVVPFGVITVESTLSVYPASNPAVGVAFSITYLDDVGQTGVANADANISRIGL